MFGAAQSDPFRTKAARRAGIGGRIRIGAHFKRPDLVSPLHQCVKLTRQFRLLHRHMTMQHLPHRAINGNEVTLFQRDATGHHNLTGIINTQATSP